MKAAAEKIHQLEEELVGVVGNEWVSRQDNSPIVQPRTVEEVAAILRKANRQGVPVRPRGGGTGWWSSTQPPEGGVLLHMIYKTDQENARPEGDHEPRGSRTALESKRFMNRPYRLGDKIRPSLNGGKIPIPSK